LDPFMGLVGAALITRWSWLLLKETSSVLLDQQRSDLEESVKTAIEDDDTRISDLHLWSIGPNIYAAIVSVVSYEPESPDFYRQRIQARCHTLMHITVEPQRYTVESDPK
jgi:Co/Zn/Cd efflux system component